MVSPGHKSRYNSTDALRRHSATRCAGLNWRWGDWDVGLNAAMRIVSDCQDRAMLLMQIAREYPALKDRATYVAEEWLLVAAIAARLPEERVQSADQMM